MVARDPEGRADRPDSLTEPQALIVLGGGPAQRHAIDAAQRLGVTAVVCDVDPLRGDVAVSSEDLEGVVLVARERAAAGLIAPGTDWPVRVAARAAHRLHLPHPISPSVAELATDKLAQRQALAAAGVPQPAWSAEMPPTLPAVVKAPDLQGQRAMSVVAFEDEVGIATARARAASRSGRVLYEEYVPGPELTVNGFSVDGVYQAVLVTDRLHFEGVPGVCEAHVFPALEGAEQAAAVAERAVRALGIQHGPSYVQMIMGPAGLAVMEVAARLGGGHDSELALRVTGVDLAAASVRAALGRPVAPGDLAPRPSGAGVIRFLRAPEGRLVSAGGPPQATFYHPPGHVYRQLRIATDRAGYVLISARDREEAVEAARSACETVEFEVE